jgi:hypothetical protein
MRCRVLASASLTLAAAALLASTAALSSSAQEKDPFDYIRSDERLSAEVTLRLNGEALKDAAAVLEAATGAKISVDQDIAEDKVTIFCKGQPASEVMIQIAKLFGYHYRAQRIAGEPRYTLFTDDATRALEQKLKRRAIDGVFDQINKVVARYVREAPTPEDHEKLRESVKQRAREFAERWRASGGEVSSDETSSFDEDIMLTTFCLPHRSIPLLYSRLSEGQIDALKDGQDVVFANYEYQGAYPIPDDLVGLLAEKPETYFSLTPPTEDAEGAQEDTKSVVGVRVEFCRHLEREGWPRLYVGAAVWHVFQDGTEKCARSAITMSRPLRTEAPPQLKEAPETGPGDPLLQTPVKVTPRIDPWMVDLGVAPEEEGRNHELLPSKEAPRSLTSPSAAFKERGFYTASHLIEELSSQVPVSMIADHYDMPYYASATGKAFGDQIDALSDYGYDLTRDRDWFRLRQRDWFEYRSSQVPNHLLLKWLAVEDERGGFDLPELAEMALLPEEQRRNIADSDFGWLHILFKSLGTMSWLWEQPEWEWLQAYAMCTKEQQSDLMRGDAISFASMPEAGQRALSQAVAEAPKGFAGEPTGRIAFSISREEEDSTCLLRRGVTSDADVGEYERLPISKRDLQATLEELKEMDPSLTIGDFEVFRTTAVTFRLSADDWSKSYTLRLLRVANMPSANDVAGAASRKEGEAARD